MVDTFDDALEVENPAEILRNENGTFEVTSPFGHIFQVTCRRGTKMNVREVSEPKFPQSAVRAVWRIRRVHQAVA